MGFLDIFKKKNPPSIETDAIEKEMYRTNPQYRAMRDRINHQNALIDRANAARAKYKEDSDAQAAIIEYEKLLIDAEPPLISDSHTLFLADLYIKTGENNKAWGYLNRLIADDMKGNNRAPIHKIRLTMARILKKEKKYIPAIEMYMMSHLKKAEQFNRFEAEPFKKDVYSCASKLKWESDKIDYLACLIDQQVRRRDYSEERIITAYRKFIDAQNAPQ